MLKTIKDKVMGTIQRFKRKKETPVVSNSEYAAIEGLDNNLIQLKQRKRNEKSIQVQKQRSQQKNWKKWKKRI